MSIINALASVAVKDLNSAVKWYEALLRKAPSRPMPELAEWSFERGGWLQVYQLPERAGSGSFTLAVSNMEEEVARLKKLNIDTSQRTSGERVKTLMITTRMAITSLSQRPLIRAWLDKCQTESSGLLSKRRLAYQRDRACLGIDADHVTVGKLIERIF